MQVDLQKILSISGYSGLFRYLSQGRSGVIVESLAADHKRMCAGPSAKVSTLGDIAIYTDGEDISLKEVLEKIKEKQNGAAAVNHKSTPEELKAFFAEVLPNYDRDRVYVSHIKKVIEWYNLLQANDMLDFVDPEKEEEDKKDESES